MPEFLLNAWDYTYLFLISHLNEIGILVILVILGFIIKYTESTNPYADLSYSLSRTALEALKDTFDQIGKSLRLDSPDQHAKTISGHLAVLYENFKNEGDRLLKTSIGGLQAHANEIIMVFGNDNHLRTWRIAGAVVNAILLGIFILADIIQAAYSLSETTGFSGITARFLMANPGLDNLPLSIMISSVGASATLAFVLMDMWGITKFVPWEDALKQNGRSSTLDRLKIIVILLIVMTVFISPMFALARLHGLRFKLSIVNELIAIVPMLAQVLVLIPMLATTVFLSYGVMIVYVIYLIALKILQLLLFGIRGIFFLLSGLLSAIGPASTPAVGLFLIIFLGVIIILGMIAGVILTVADSIFFLLGFIFLAVFGVFRGFAIVINRVFKIR